MIEPESDKTDETTPESQEENVLSIMESNYSKANKLYYEDHDYQKAIEEYKLALEKETDENIRAKIIYMIAESHVKLGKLKKAREIFQTIAVKYKHYYINDSARKRIEHLNDYLIEKE